MMLRQHLKPEGWRIRQETKCEASLAEGREADVVRSRCTEEEVLDKAGSIGGIEARRDLEPTAIECWEILVKKC
jgi:hypothetical protein